MRSNAIVKYSAILKYSTVQSSAMQCSTMGSEMQYIHSNAAQCCAVQYSPTRSSNIFKHQTPLNN